MVGKKLGHTERKEQKTQPGPQAGGCLAEDLMNMDVAAPSAPSPGLAECKHTTTTTRLGWWCGTATIPTFLHEAVLLSSFCVA
ncbi:unnamed protein product [Gadus morhua 'NCC']